MLLAVAGKFPGQDYEDGRFAATPEVCAANLGRMPLLSQGDETIGQSAAINYYVAAENGLLGSSNLEAAKIISIGEHVKEMMTGFRLVVPWGTEPKEEELAKWFDGGATDFTGPADRAGHSTRFLKWWLNRIEATLGDQGFAVGTKLSLADVALYNVFAEYLKDTEAAEGTPSWRKEAFCSKARTDAAVASCPKVAACCAAVANDANVQKYLSSRGVQMF